MAQGSSDTEWVELYNPTSQTISLENWILKDNNSSTTDDIKLSGSINPNEIKVFERTKGWLNDSGDSVTLVDNTGQNIDSYTYGNSSIDKSFGKIPDGESWQNDLTPTKGLTNGNPTPTSSPTASTQTTNSDSTITANFSISGTPSQIKSDQSFSIPVTLSLPNSPNTIYYLKGSFKKSDGSRYFGLTKKDSNWIQYGDDPLNQIKITTDSTGGWSGNLEFKVDIDDGDYKGSGSYIFKVGRFTSSGSGPTWSNEQILNIQDTSNQTTVTPTPKATTIPSPTTKTASPSAEIKSATASYTINENDYKIPDLSSDGGSNVLGESSISKKNQVQTKHSKNWFLIGTSIIIITLVCGVTYRYYKTGKLLK